MRLATRPALAMSPVMAMLPAMAGAADGAAPGPVAGMLQMLAALAVVVAALGGVAWLLRRYARPAAGKAGLLRVIGSQSLGPRERLVVVEVGEFWLVLGVTGQAINALHTMPRREDTPPDEPPAGFDFARLLTRALQPRTRT